MSSGLYIDRKRQFSVLKWVASIVVVAVVFAVSWFAYQWFVYGTKPPVVSLPASAMADPEVDETPVTNTMIETHTVPNEHPRYVSIPSLNITKARVQSVGLTETNNIDTPKNISDTAWYDKSATPGQGVGSVLINGHNGGITKDGVFAGLDKLKEADIITVERGDGTKITYKVVESKTVSLKEANETGVKSLLQSQDPSKEGLGLITCAGNWVPRDKVFDKRVLVRAVAVD